MMLEPSHEIQGLANPQAGNSHAELRVGTALQNSVEGFQLRGKVSLIRGIRILASADQRLGLRLRSLRVRLWKVPCHLTIDSSRSRTTIWPPHNLPRSPHSLPRSPAAFGATTRHAAGGPPRPRVSSCRPEMLPLRAQIPTTPRPDTLKVPRRSGYLYSVWSGGCGDLGLERRHSGRLKAPGRCWESGYLSLIHI